jgi:hypothetical protein
MEESCHHSLVLRVSAAPACTRLGFRVFRDEELEALADELASRGLAPEWADGDFQGRTLRVAGGAARVLCADAAAATPVDALSPLSRRWPPAPRPLPAACARRARARRLLHRSRISDKRIRDAGRRRGDRRVTAAQGQPARHRPLGRARSPLSPGRIHDRRRPAADARVRRRRRTRLRLTRGARPRPPRSRPRAVRLHAGSRRPPRRVVHHALPDARHRRRADPLGRARAQFGMPWGCRRSVPGTWRPLGSPASR